MRLNTLNDAKLLLTIEQVDEKFPVTTYDEWKSKRQSRPQSSESAVPLLTRSLSLQKSHVENPLEALNDDTCAICIEWFHDTDHIRALTCGHCYHNGCIDRWLTMERGACPLCNRNYHDASLDPLKAYDTTLAPPPPVAFTEFNDASVTGRRGWTRPIGMLHLFGRDRARSDESQLERGNL
jgi:hypothetical protein